MELSGRPAAVYLTGQTSPEKEELMEDQMTTAAETTETTDGFLDGWDDAPGAETADQQEERVEAEEEQQEEVPAVPESEDAQQDQTQEGPAAQDPQAQTPRTWELRHMGEVRTVGEEELTVLAQKGMDYDRIRSKYDESKPVMELFSHLARGAGMDVAAYVADMRAKVKQMNGMSAEDARRAVSLEDREAAVAAKEAVQTQRQADANATAQAKAAADMRRRADIEEFKRTFPDAAKDPKAIPQEVWNEVNRGSTLVSAYSRYAVAQAKAAQAAAERSAAVSAQNQKNAARSTGSMKSAGENSKGHDDFLDAFERG